MIIVSGYYDELIGVLGLGKTGLSAVHSLLVGHARVAVWDDRPEVIEALRLVPYRARTISELILGQAILDGKLLISPDPAEYIPKLTGFLLSPGIATVYPHPHPLIALAHQHNLPLWSDIMLLQQTCQHARYIAVTGTNGKSTTTALIGHIYHTCGLRAEVGGNIGKTVLELKPLDATGSYVLELSSFQLELLKALRVDIAVLLNITPDHMDRYSSITEYERAKCNIFTGQTTSSYAIISQDYENTKLIMSRLTQKQKVVAISALDRAKNGVSVFGGVIYDDLAVDSPMHYELGELPNLRGRHNAENLAAAYAVCRLSGIKGEQIISALDSFPGLPHRMQNILKSNGLCFINDSKATNTDSARMSLETFDDIIWIAGGICKDSGIEPLHDLFSKLKHVYLVGQAASQFSEILARYKVPHTIAGSLEKALLLISTAHKNGTVLLAPACASYDQWLNFEERGEAFCNLVHKHFE